MTEFDRDLLPRCRRGEEVAWRELVARHTRRVFGLAYRFTGRVDEAEDLTQEIFVKVYQTLDRYREADGAFSGWLMAVARNHAIDHYRRQRQEQLRRVEDAGLIDVLPAREEGPLGKLEREERTRLVHRGLRALPVELRVPLILHDLQGLPYGDIAATLQLPLGTVKSRINRARLELARRLLGRLGRTAGARSQGCGRSPMATNETGGGAKTVIAEASCLRHQPRPVGVSGKGRGPSSRHC